MMSEMAFGDGAWGGLSRSERATLFELSASLVRSLYLYGRRRAGLVVSRYGRVSGRLGSGGLVLWCDSEPVRCRL